MGTYFIYRLLILTGRSCGSRLISYHPQLLHALPFCHYFLTPPLNNAPLRYKENHHGLLTLDWVKTAGRAKVAFNKAGLESPLYDTGDKAKPKSRKRMSK